MSTARRLDPSPHHDEPIRSRYPHFNVLDKWATPDWDDQTRAAIRRRLENVPSIRFFTEAEARVLEAVVERILPQPDRPAGGKIPIVPWIDEKLSDDKRDGYRRDSLPPQRDLWRTALRGIDQTSEAVFGAPFVALDPVAQDTVLRKIQHDEAPGETWRKIPAHVFFSKVLTIAVVKTYYAHPAAWNDIGYHGPSSPRGYSRFWDGGVDPWDAEFEEAPDAE